jgi:hypothetical protein
LAASQAAQPRGGHAQRAPDSLLRPGAPGRPLPDAVRAKMEGFFQADFSDVRVHVGAEAPSIGALAFTLGSRLFFAPGQYNPESTAGQALLGHELAHVLQQRAGRVRNPFGNGVAVVQDPALEAEAERLGQQAAGWRQLRVTAAKGSQRAGSNEPGTVQPMMSLHRLSKQAFKIMIRSASSWSKPPRAPLKLKQLEHLPDEHKGVTIHETEKGLSEKNPGSYEAAESKIHILKGLNTYDRKLIVGHEITHHINRTMTSDINDEGAFYNTLMDELTANVKEAIIGQLFYSFLSPLHKRKVAFYRDNPFAYVKWIVDIYSARYANRFIELPRKKREETALKALVDYCTAMKITIPKSE